MHCRAAWISSWLKTSLCKVTGRSGSRTWVREGTPLRKATRSRDGLGRGGKDAPRCGLCPSEPGGRRAHLRVAAPDLDDAVADGQQELQDAVGVPALGLHQGLAQGQPHVAGQAVLAVLPGGPAAKVPSGACPSQRSSAPAQPTALAPSLQAAPCRWAPRLVEGRASGRGGDQLKRWPRSPSTRPQDRPQGAHTPPPARASRWRPGRAASPGPAAETPPPRLPLASMVTGSGPHQCQEPARGASLSHRLPQQHPPRSAHGGTGSGERSASGTPHIPGEAAV